jgi:hypothetical protein
MAGNFEMTNVKTVQVEKGRLLKTLHQNLGKHRVEYLTAVQGYHEKVDALIKKLAATAAHATPDRRGPGLDAIHEVHSELMHLDRPSNHSDSYEQAIALMEWETRETVELSINDFECYVRDNWTWMTSFKNTVSNYSGGRH